MWLVPRMIGAGRAARPADASTFPRHLMPELFYPNLKVARVTEVARVIVLVAAALYQRDDVVDHRRQRHTLLAVAAFA